MINTFQGTNAYAVYAQAVRMVGYEALKTALLAALSASPAFTQEQKLAIRIAGSELQNYPGSDIMAVDGPLLGICFLKFEDIGAEGTMALADVQREGIIAGLMAICKGVITDEAARLNAVAALDTKIPAGWNDAEQEEEPV